MEGWRQRRPSSNENNFLVRKRKTVLTRTGLLIEGLIRIYQAKIARLEWIDCCIFTGGYMRARLSLVLGLMFIALIGPPDEE
jgi:hypothetical protein